MVNTREQKAGIVYRQRIPKGEDLFPVILLLHGWTGDENSMWLFAPRLPDAAILLSPRAPYDAPQGGYSWNQAVHGKPRLEDFLPGVDFLLDFLESSRFPQADLSRLHLMGFSQGAALAACFCLLHPEKVTSLTMLSGFMPEGLEKYARNQRLSGMPVFIAHGTLDTMVTIDQARKCVEIIEKSGARPIYCEDDVGHKLSANCFRGLEKFFQDQIV
jgi:phospholipase/carboxylesterase